MKVRLFGNDNEKSKIIIKEVKTRLENNGFEVVKDNYELAIAVGGDGSFLRMVKQSNFNSDVLYVGINAGTLGFAQEVAVEELDDFISELKSGDYKVDSIGIQETRVITGNTVSNFYSLNEMVVREKELNTMVMDVKIEDVFLQRFVGDGLLVATSFGSTAYNLSFGGSIIYNTFHTLQITPIAPLNNMSYRNLLNSVVIPENKLITLIPNNLRNNLVLTIDGENGTYENVSLIETFVDKKRIRCLRRKDYDFAKKINEKFLK
ncbi:MAG: hypothetical protein U0M66_02840 [Bacilli bacterium]|nr:hypothetical protein [Bacilli bacterium]